MRLLPILLIILCNSSYSQVYEYLPVSYTNIETNLSFVASEKNDFIAKCYHINNFQKQDNFNYTTLRFSNYFKNRFWGFGLFISNTRIKDTIKYKHAGLSLGYRNILFDKVYVRIGANYKIIDMNSPKGFFTKYDFEYEENIMINDALHNMNLSVTFSSNQEILYLTIGTLNYEFTQSAKSYNYFPRYNYLKFGNLIQYIEGTTRVNSDISFLIINECNFKENNILGYYISAYNSWSLSRSLTSRYGGDFGYKEYINLRPYFKIIKDIYYSKKRERKDRGWYQTSYIQLKLSSDFAFNNNFSKQIYKPAYQFGLFYNF